MNKSKNSSGFSAVEIVLVLIIVGLAGVLGFLAYKNYSSKSTAVTSSDSSKEVASSTSADTAAADPTAGWTTYVGADNKISFKYPVDWASAADPEMCSAGVFLLAPIPDTIGVCGSESFGQISFTWQKSSQSCNNFFDDSSSIIDDKGQVTMTKKNEKKESVMVSGVTGVKYSDTSTGNGPYSAPAGTAEISYCFNNGGYLYLAQYSGRPTYPDAKSDFNTIVMKTLKFSN